MKPSNRITLYLVIFLSGFSALVYQLVWVKKLELFFGTHVFAISAVLTAFMAGLGIGSLVFGKWADSSRHPLWILIFIESGLVLFALFFNPLFEFVLEVYNRGIQGQEYPGNRIYFIRFLFASGFLLFPSLLMGGTMPLFMKMITQSVTMVGRNASRYYVFNNLGAFLGCILCGFFFIKSMGLDKTMQFAAVLNFLNILILLRFLLEYKNSPVNPEPSDKDTLQTAELPAGMIRWVLYIFTIEGFTTLAYEVVWTRILTEFSYDKTSYLFTVILAGFIFGLSLGSLIIGRLTDRLKNPVVLLAGIQVSIGLISILSLVLASRFMPVMIEGRDVSKSWFSTSLTEYLLIFLMLTIPVTLMGMTFPIVCRIYNRKMSHMGMNFGKLGFLDVIGSVFGSSLTALLILPKLGSIFTFLLVALLNFIPGLVLYSKAPFISPGIRKKRILGFLLLLMVTLAFLPTNRFFKTQIGKRPGEEILFYKEGLSGTVSVHSYNHGKKALAINGALYAFTNYDDALSHKLLAYVPLFLRQDPEDVLVIGYGMGITGSSFLQAGVKRLDIAEINPQVPLAAAVYFSHQNRNLIQRPELHLINDDGRAYLVSSKKEYDVITCDATHPRYGDNLYTSEFYRLCREHLSDSGIMCNWMPFNWITTMDYKSMLSSFMEEFPCVSLWYINRGVCLMVGSDQKLVPDRNRWIEKFRDPGIREDMHSIDILNPAELVARNITGRDELEKWIGDVKANTDNLPLIEYGRKASMAPDPDVLQWILEMMDNQEDAEFCDRGTSDDRISFRRRINAEKRKIASDIGFEIERVRESGK